MAGPPETRIWTATGFPGQLCADAPDGVENRASRPIITDLIMGAPRFGLLAFAGGQVRIRGSWFIGAAAPERLFLPLGRCDHAIIWAGPGGRADVRGTRDRAIARSRWSCPEKPNHDAGAGDAEKI